MGACSFQWMTLVLDKNFAIIRKRGGNWNHGWILWPRSNAQRLICSFVLLKKCYFLFIDCVFFLMYAGQSFLTSLRPCEIIILRVYLRIKSGILFLSINSGWKCLVKFGYFRYYLESLFKESVSLNIMEQWTFTFSSIYSLQFKLNFSILKHPRTFLFHSYLCGVGKRKSDYDVIRQFSIYCRKN